MKCRAYSQPRIYPYKVQDIDSARPFYVDKVRLEAPALRSLCKALHILHGAPLGPWKIK